MTLSLDQARRLALTAQGLDRPRPGRVDIRHLRRELNRLGVLQLDFVNVLAPAHQLVLFSRLGPYDTDKLDELVYARREFTEQWAHERSIVPVDAWPLLEHRFESFRIRPWGFERFVEERPEYVERALDRVRADGPLAAEDLEEPDDVPAGVVRVSSYPLTKAVLEAHFAWGNLAVAGRRSDNACLYDLAERVVPAEHLDGGRDPSEARRRLLLRAARAQGVATANDLADYWRMGVRETRAHLAGLVEDGALEEAAVEGWDEPAFRHPDARMARSIDAVTLLSPFDPVVWFRPRAERLFDFHYRIEIYTPAKQRQWGYYVLPFLMGTRIVGRVDLKADRCGGRLLVQAAYLEEGAGAGPVAEALAGELRQVAAWQGLDDVVVRRKGDLSGPLRAAVEST